MEWMSTVEGCPTTCLAPRTLKSKEHLLVISRGQFVMDVICLQETEFRSAMRGRAISECAARLQDVPATAADAE